MELHSLLSIHEIFKIIDKYRSQCIVALVIFSTLVGSGVYWYITYLQREQNAVQAIAEIFSEYHRAYDNSEFWQDIEVGAKTGYRQYSKSRIAPFFLVIQADALLGQEKIDDAIAIMDDALKKIPSNLPFYYFYQIKNSRMKLASKNVTTQEQGLISLKKLAEMKENPQKAQAQYYLAQHYFYHDKQSEAEKIWKNMVEEENKSKEENKNETDLKGPSTWVMLAEQKIQAI